MTTRYDRKESDLKPSKSTSMEHVRVGGWAQVYVDGDDDEKVFGYIRHISGRRITLEIADEVFSPAKTGLRDGQFIRQASKNHLERPAESGRADFAFDSPGLPLGSFTKEMQAFSFSA